MGIILSALAAAGDSGVESINQNIKQQNQMDLETQRMDLETQKAKTVAQFTNDLAVKTENEKRDATVARISAAQAPIIQAAIDKKYAGAADVAAGNTDSLLSPEQQAVVDAAKKSDYDTMKTDPNTLIQAMSQSGDLTSKELVTTMLDQHRQAAAAAAEVRKSAYDQGKLANDERRNDIRDRQVDVNADKVAGMLARVASGGAKDKTPAEVMATEWLMAHKDDPEAMAAWDRQHTGKAKDTVTVAAELVKSDPNRGTAKAMTPAAAVDVVNSLKSQDGRTPFVNRPATPAPAKPFNPADFQK